MTSLWLRNVKRGSIQIRCIVLEPHQRSSFPLLLKLTFAQKSFQNGSYNSHLQALQLVLRSVLLKGCLLCPFKWGTFVGQITFWTSYIALDSIFFFDDFVVFNNWYVYLYIDINGFSICTCSSCIYYVIM